MIPEFSESQGDWVFTMKECGIGQEQLTAVEGRRTHVILYDYKLQHREKQGSKYPDIKIQGCCLNLDSLDSADVNMFIRRIGSQGVGLANTFPGFAKNTHLRVRCSSACVQDGCSGLEVIAKKSVERALCHE